MANLVPCKSCGHNVARSAKSCPQCGVSNPGTKASDAAKGFAILAMIGFAVWAAIPSSKPLTPEQIERRDQVDAIVACHVLIKMNLHDPDSAEFGDPKHIEHTGNTWTMQVPTRAKNGFNAMRLANYQCAVRKTGDIWQPIGASQI